MPDPANHDNFFKNLIVGFPMHIVLSFSKYPTEDKRTKGARG
jgi:hypothetical protein